LEEEEWCFLLGEPCLSLDEELFDLDGEEPCLDEDDLWWPLLLLDLCLDGEPCLDEEDLWRSSLSLFLDHAQE
jgi:hypothetical protein